MAFNYTHVDFINTTTPN